MNRDLSEPRGRHTALQEALHHGCETRSAQLRPLRLAGEAGATDKEIPPDGADRLPGTGDEGTHTNRPVKKKSFYHGLN